MFADSTHSGKDSQEPANPKYRTDYNCTYWENNSLDFATSHFLKMENRNQRTDGIIPDKTTYYLKAEMCGAMFEKDTVTIANMVKMQGKTEKTMRPCICEYEGTSKVSGKAIYK